MLHGLIDVSTKSLAGCEKRVEHFEFLVCSFKFDI